MTFIIVDLFTMVGKIYNNGIIISELINDKSQYSIIIPCGIIIFSYYLSFSLIKIFASYVVCTKCFPFSGIGIMILCIHMLTIEVEKIYRFVSMIKMFCIVFNQFHVVESESLCISIGKH